MDELVKAAIKVRKNAYAPYSKFCVGAAVLGASGKIYIGANVENASYGLTICAERAAVVSALSQGERELKAIAIAADTDEPVLPCGACCQVIAEFNITKIILANLQGSIIELTLKELLPYAFNNKVMFKGEIVHEK